MSRRSAATAGDTAVIYCRLSQDRNGEGLAVERQLRECRELAKKLGLRVTKVYTDNDISATTGKTRPGFEELLAARPTAVVVWHQDRLLRLTSDLERVIKLDIPIYTVTAGDFDLATPAGRAVARTIAAWSTYEGEQKALRQMASNRQRAERGIWQFSRRPYGYERRDGRIEIIESEAAIIREGFDRYLAGETYYRLADDWNERAVPTFNGTPWTMARVRELLRNPRYAGIVDYKGVRVEAEAIEWEPLISRETWDKAEAMRGDRRRAGSWSTSTKHLGSGLYRCGVCGSRVTSRPDRGRQVYACSAAWCVSRGAEDVDRLVAGVVIGRLRDPKVVERLHERPDTAPLVAEIDSLRQRRDDIIDLMAEGVLDGANARRRAQGLTEQIDLLSERLSAIRAKSPMTDLAMTKQIPRRWSKLPVLDQRRIISELGLIVTLLPVGSGYRIFDPASVEFGWEFA